MMSLIYQYFHMPTTGAGYAAWFFFIYSCLSEALPFMKRIVPNGVLQMALMMLSAGMKAITINKDAGTITIDLKELEAAGVPSDTNISLVNSSASEPVGVATPDKPTPLADVPPALYNG
jgi:ribonuclease PH